MSTYRNHDVRLGLLGAALALALVAVSGGIAPAAATTQSETVSAGQEGTPSVTRTARENGFGRRGGDR